MDPATGRPPQWWQALSEQEQMAAIARVMLAMPVSAADIQLALQTPVHIPFQGMRQPSLLDDNYSGYTSKPPKPPRKRGTGKKNKQYKWKIM